MGDGVEIVSVDATNVDEVGFFCYKSKRKSIGYQRKLAWLRERLAEGMRVEIVYEHGRSVGFIEYTPGELAWRAVRAPGYLVVHCIWVVGRAKQKGYGSRLLRGCIEQAREQGKRGVAMVTSSGTWVAGKELLVKNGFESVDEAPPTFELLVRSFEEGPLPSFPTDWEERLARYGPGLTVVRSAQCPYIENATRGALRAAEERGVTARVVELGSSREVQESAPSAYGVFSVVYEGELLTYHFLGDKEIRRLDQGVG